jgi:hypothetical protein
MIAHEPPAVAAVGTLQIGPFVAHPYEGFWAVTLVGTQLLNSTLAAQFNATPFVLIRYGGNVDATNVSNGCTYSDAGVCGRLSMNYTSFRTFCGWVHCRSVLGVPAESNDPGLAAETVRHVEQVVGFIPTFWSIGNEPESWTHFGVPLHFWRLTDRSTPTPAEFGQLAATITGAIRSVDPTVRIIGDQDAQQGVAPQFLENLSQRDDANLTAVAFHSYPGRGGPTTPSEAQFLSNFNVTRTTTFLTQDEVAYRRGCGCNKSIMVGEFNGAFAGTFSPYLSGYPDVPMTAAVAAQLLAANASAFTFFSFWGRAPFYLLNASTGAGSPTYQFFAGLAAYLPMGSTYRATVNTTVSGIYAVEEIDNRSQQGVLLVSTNTTQTVSVSLGDLMTNRLGTVIRDAPGSGISVDRYEAASAPGSIDLAPEEVALLLPGYGGPANGSSEGGSGTPSPALVGAPSAVWVITAAAGLGAVAAGWVVLTRRRRSPGR